MLVMILISAATASPPVAHRGTARASVRIVQSARATQQLWNDATRRRERLITDEQGRTYRLRTIDFE